MNPDIDERKRQRGTLARSEVRRYRREPPLSGVASQAFRGWRNATTVLRERRLEIHLRSALPREHLAGPFDRLVEHALANLESTSRKSGRGASPQGAVR